MWRKSHANDNRQIFIAVVVCLLMVVSGGVANKLVENILADRSFDMMEKQVEQMSIDLRGKMADEEDQMHLIAGMMAIHDYDEEALWQQHIDALPVKGDITVYSVLLPNNSMLFANGGSIDMKTQLDFAVEAARGFHVTEVIRNENGNYVAYAQPIEAAGRVKGILYGYIDLADLAEFFNQHAFNEQCNMYLVDGDSGDFWVDTLHSSLGNMYDSNLIYKPVKKGRTFKEMKEDVAAGQPGYSVFVSKSTGQDFYSYYQPVGIGNLSLQVTVPEAVVFADAVAIQQLVQIFVFLQLMLCAAYLCYLFYRSRKRSREYHVIIDQSQFAYNVQQLLFGAYREPYCITVAMHMLAEYTGAKVTAFSHMRNDKVRQVFCWPMQEREMLEQVSENECPPDIWEKLVSGKTMVLDREEIGRRRMLGQLGNSADIHIENMIISPVVKKDTGILGTLSLINVKEPEQYADLLSTLAESLMMSVQNVEAYYIIKKMGTLDELTGLKNRNAYQQAVMDCEGSDSGLCCIYVDANGLHDLNNTLGHEAGDRMLASVADTLKESFGANNSYRIGGDEFVVLADWQDEALVMEKVAAAKAQLDAMDYHISAGWSFCPDGNFLQRTIKAAEKAMYADKERYYKEQGREKKNRQMNHKLEDMMAEKRDRDSFLRIIAAEFMGVYAVNLATDDTRVIYRPDYFAELLENNGFRFRNALRDYVELYVARESHGALAIAFDYKRIEQRLADNSYLEFSYLKLDGAVVRIRIYKAEDYSETNRNTLWIFEQANV